MVAAVGGDDDRLRTIGDGVNERTQPLSNPSGSRQRCKLCQFSRVVVDVTAEKVAAKPDHDAVNLRQLAFVLEEPEEPLVEFVQTKLTYVKAVVVQVVDGVGIDTLFAVDVREQHDHRRCVLRPFGGLGQ